MFRLYHYKKRLVIYVTVHKSTHAYLIKVGQCITIPCEYLEQSATVDVLEGHALVFPLHLKATTLENCCICICTIQASCWTTCVASYNTLLHIFTVHACACSAYRHWADQLFIAYTHVVFSIATDVPVSVYVWTPMLMLVSDNGVLIFMSRLLITMSWCVLDALRSSCISLR